MYPRIKGNPADDFLDWSGDFCWHITNKNNKRRYWFDDNILKEDCNYDGDVIKDIKFDGIKVTLDEAKDALAKLLEQHNVLKEYYIGVSVGKSNVYFNFKKSFVDFIQTNRTKYK